VKRLIQILLGAFVVFMALAVVQEWSFFSAAWFGEPAATEQASEADREAASETVRQMLVIMRHLYSSDGDPRFAERMPTSDGIRAEMLADIDYLGRNRRRQDPALMKLEILGVDSLDRDRLEVRTREFWRVDFYSLVDGEPSDEPLWQVVHGRYLAIRTGTGWRIDGWEFTSAEPTEAPGA